MKISTLNQQGTIAITIPKDIARSFGWQSGQEVIICPTDKEFELKLVNQTLKELHK